MIPSIVQETGLDACMGIGINKKVGYYFPPRERSLSGKNAKPDRKIIASPKHFDNLYIKIYNRVYKGKGAKGW